MTARQVIEFRNEFGGETVEVISADPSGGMPPFRAMSVEDDKGRKQVIVLSEPDSAKVAGALLPSMWWEALLRQAYRMGWAGGAQETGGVDAYSADKAHPREDEIVARLLAVPPT